MLELIFTIFALLTIVPCFWVAFSPKIVHAAFSLLFTLFGAAGLLVLLGGDFIGVVQVVVYIGGILVLLIFGVMMTQGARLAPLTVQLPARGLAALLCLVLLGLTLLGLFRTDWPQSENLPAPQPTTEAIGDLLLGKYLLPFETASLMLLAALIGALLIVRRAVKEG